MLFTAEKVKSNPILAQIIKNNPRVFVEKYSDISEHLILTLGIFYEIGKSRQSYWYPWLRQMLDIETLEFWSLEELDFLQNEHEKHFLIAQKEAILQLWIHFEQMLLANLTIFPEKLISKSLFLKIYHQVRTRCVETGLRGSAMIPMFDNLNHSNLSSCNDIINLSL